MSDNDKHAQHWHLLWIPCFHGMSSSTSVHFKLQSDWLRPWLITLQGMSRSSSPACLLTGCMRHLQEGDAPTMARQQLLSQLLAAAWQLQDHIATSALPSTSHPVHSEASAAQGSQGPSQVSVCEDSKLQTPTSTIPRHSEDARPGMAHSSSKPDSHSVSQTSDTRSQQPGADSLSENATISQPEQGEPEVGSAGTSLVSEPCTLQNLAPGTRDYHGCMDLLTLSWSVMPPGLEAEAFQLLDLASGPQHAAAAVAAADRSLEAALASSGRPCLMASARLGVGGQQGPSQVQPSS